VLLHNKFAPVLAPSIKTRHRKSEKSFIINALKGKFRPLNIYAYFAWLKKQFGSGLSRQKRYLLSRTAATHVAARYRVFSLTEFRS